MESLLNLLALLSIMPLSLLALAWVMDAISSVRRGTLVVLCRWAPFTAYGTFILVAVYAAAYALLQPLAPGHGVFARFAFSVPLLLAAAAAVAWSCGGRLKRLATN